MPKPWSAKMQTPPPFVSVVEKANGKLLPGMRLLISSPLEIDAWLRTHVPLGQTVTVPELRAALAQVHDADACCALTTGIFLRIVAENAWEALQAGAALGEMAPFWRCVEPRSPLAAKLRCGAAWISAQRRAEEAL